MSFVTFGHQWLKLGTVLCPTPGQTILVGLNHFGRWVFPSTDGEWRMKSHKVSNFALVVPAAFRSSVPRPLFLRVFVHELSLFLFKGPFPGWALEKCFTTAFIILQLILLMIPKICFRLYWCVRSTLPQSGTQVACHLFFAEFKQKVDRHDTIPIALVAVSGAKIAQGWGLTHRIVIVDDESGGSQWSRCSLLDRDRSMQVPRHRYM